MKKNFSPKVLRLFFVSRKTLSVIKLSAIFIVCTSVFSLASANSLLQNAKVNLDVKNKTIKEVLLEIKNQTNYSFLYNNEELNDNKRVSISVSDNSVNEVLDILLAGQDLAYSLDGNIISIYKPGKTARSAVSQPQTNNRSITGTVVAPDGSPVIGATVAVPSTSIGTVSDVSGKFNLNVPEDASIVVSYVGYITQEIKVGDRRAIDIVMAEDIGQIEEIVVVGFGTQKKVNLTGAISTVDSKAFEDRAVSNVTQALQGVVPGLNIYRNSGYLDASPSINIRGTGTIGDGSSANTLILIDGVEGDINRLNPLDIESVSVLKDAASSAIYGSRAPFGVILITTKKGKAGKITTNYTNSFRWNKAENMPKWVDSYTWARYMNEAAANGGSAGFFSAERLQKIQDYQAGLIPGWGLDPRPDNPNSWGDVFDTGYSNFDWIGFMFKSTTFAHDHNVSVSGGSDKVQVYASANFQNQGGTLRLNPEEHQRLSTNLKINTQLNKYVDFSYGIRYSNIRYTSPTRGIGFGDLLRQGWPTVPAHDGNGNLHVNATWAVPVRDGGKTQNKSDEAVHNLSLVVKPLQGWRIVADLNYKKWHGRVHQDWQLLYNYDVAGNPVEYHGTNHNSNSQVRESYNGSKFFNPNIYSDYERSWNGHNFKAMAGFQFERYRADDLAAERVGIIIPGIDYINTSSGINSNGEVIPPGVSGGAGKWATAGFFGRLNYDYRERYLFEFAIRHDGTSKFLKDKRWKTFPSFSLGWNIAKESFMEPYSHIINTLKPRFSWGKLGNQDMGVNPYLNATPGIVNGGWLVNGAKPNTSSALGLVSTTLGWETVKTTNYGIDVVMFKHRLDFTFEVFKRETNNMIGPSPALPALLGTPVPVTNNTDLKTSGWEMRIAWRDRLQFGLGYHVSLVLSDSKTKITNYPDVSEHNRPANGYYTGKRLGEIWGYKTYGLAKNQEEMDRHLASLPNGGQNTIGSVHSNWGAGDLMYADLNNDGKIDGGSGVLGDMGDKVVIGNSTPRYAIGINLGADYKGFDFSMFFQGVLKRDFWPGSALDFWGARGGIWYSSALKQHMNYFRDDSNHYLGQNLNGYYPKPRFGNNNRYESDRYLIDGSYLRLKNLTIGYTIPSHITSRIGIEKLRITFTGENLFTITDVPKFYNPETLGGSIQYPLCKTYSFGVNITF